MNVFVTGGSRGIGSSIVEKFASMGNNVYFTYKNSELEAKRLKKELENKYLVDINCYHLDLENESEISNLFDEFLNNNIKLDVIVNNAGIAIDSIYEDKNKEDFMKILNINLIGPFLICKYFTKLMDSGSIINITSNNGFKGSYIEGLDYDASKAGLINLTHNLAKYYAPKIRVNSVAPGNVVTDMNKNLDSSFIDRENENTLLHRFASPSEIAEVVYFLSSDSASYICSQVIVVDGGYCG